MWTINKPGVHTIRVQHLNKSQTKKVHPRAPKSGSVETTYRKQVTVSASQRREVNPHASRSGYSAWLPSTLQPLLGEAVNGSTSQTKKVHPRAPKSGSVETTYRKQVTVSTSQRAFVHEGLCPYPELHGITWEKRQPLQELMTPCTMPSQVLVGQ
ncbi:hypothetical protein LSAT2_012694 [Lamellibrachia satsuma]|nr:hypothetical protein LSAT2_012694 [Lamellibrachia satsuma]